MITSNFPSSRPVEISTPPGLDGPPSTHLHKQPSAKMTTKTKAIAALILLGLASGIYAFKSHTNTIDAETVKKCLDDSFWNDESSFSKEGKHTPIPSSCLEPELFGNLFNQLLAKNNPISYLPYSTENLNPFFEKCFTRDNSRTENQMCKTLIEQGAFDKVLAARDKIFKTKGFLDCPNSSIGEATCLGMIRRQETFSNTARIIAEACIGSEVPECQHTLNTAYDQLAIRNMDNTNIFIGTCLEKDHSDCEPILAKHIGKLSMGNLNELTLLVNIRYLDALLQSCKWKNLQACKTVEPAKQRINQILSSRKNFAENRFKADDSFDTCMKNNENCTPILEKLTKDLSNNKDNLDKDELLKTYDSFRRMAAKYSKYSKETRPETINTSVNLIGEMLKSNHNIDLDFEKSVKDYLKYLKP